MKKRIVLWVMQSKIYRWLLRKIIPIVRFSLYYPKSDGIKYNEAYDLLQPGDIILTNDSLKLTSLLIPGEWSHAALCVSKDKRFEVAEMTHEDYVKATFFKLFHEADRVAILRCPCISQDKEYLKLVIEKCRSFEGATYDQAFELGVTALYCSELVYQADFERRLNVNLEDLAGLGREYISPDGLFKSKNVVVVYDTGVT